MRLSPANRVLRAGPLALLFLAACSETAETPTPPPTAEPTPDKPRTLVAADFAALQLGARIEGPQGPEVESTFAVDGEELAEMVSYVACPEAVEPCEPDEVPEGIVYTYVHSITPAESVTSGAVFRTARRAAGFANGVGFDRAEVAAALGEQGKIDVSSDNGALVWRVIGGDGWRGGETITFYWQSSLPPEGPAEAYQFEGDGSTAMGTGPFPPREPPAAAADDTSPR